jgi:MFS family permease
MNLQPIILTCFSIVMLGIGIRMVTQKQKRFFLGLAWIIGGLGCALVAYNPAFLNDKNSASLMFRMRIVLGFLSALVLMITLEAVRRFAMEERYALLWVFTGLILFLLAIYPDAVGWLATLTGMQYVSAITIVVFAFLLLVVFDFSMALSKLHADQRKLCQQSAELELRITELEKKQASSSCCKSSQSPT